MKRAFERAFYFIEGVEREGRRCLATGNAKREYMYTMEEKGEGRRDGREGRARPSVFSLRPVASHSGKAILDEREPPKTLLPESHITT